MLQDLESKTNGGLKLNYRSPYWDFQPWTMHVKTEKKFGELRGDLGAIE